MKSAMENYYLEEEKRTYDKIIFRRPRTDVYFGVNREILESLERGEREEVRVTRLKLSKFLNQLSGKLEDVLIDAAGAEPERPDSYKRPLTDFFLDFTPEDLKLLERLGMQGEGDTPPYHVFPHYYECPISNPPQRKVDFLIVGRKVPE